MHPIDQTQLQLNPAAAMVLSLVVGFLVFGVALDLRGDDFRRVLRAPRAPLVGLVAQFGVLPAVGFLVAVALAQTPSVALGLILVASCPGGSLSNYFTAVARGDVALSVSMTAVSTIGSLVLTPLVFSFWASQHPDAATLLRAIPIDPGRVVGMVLVMVGIPVVLGMSVEAWLPRVAARIRGAVRTASLVAFAGMVIMIAGANAKAVVSHPGVVLVPVLVAFTASVAAGWLLGRVAGLDPRARRAVAIEVGLQNVGLGMGIGVAMFPTLGGVATIPAVWGLVHLAGGAALSAAWRRVPVPAV